MADQSTPAEELAALETLDLAPTDDLVVTEEAPPPLGRSWAFDFITKRFLSQGQHGPAETYGDDTLVFWVEKCLHTARGAHPIYPNDYGMERPFDHIGRMMDTADYGDLEGRIHDALVFHPRIVDVTDFEANQEPDDDALFVTFRIVKDDGTAVQVTDLEIA
jgi:hypothetical protein